MRICVTTWRAKLRNRVDVSSFQESNFLRSVIVLLGFPIAVYLLYVQLFIGFIQFGYQSSDTGDGLTYSEILEEQKEKAVSATIFKVSERDLLGTININNKTPRYLAFNVNYMDADEVSILISFKANELEIAQDQFTFTQGISYYKIPDVGTFDKLEFIILNKQTLAMGMNGISTLSALGMNKFGLSLGFLTFFLIILGRVVLRNSSAKDFAMKLMEVKYNFQDFVKTFKSEFLLLVCVGILGYGFLCVNFTLSIDEELFWMIKDGSAWVGYGRFGNYFLDKYFTFDSSVMPFFTDVLAVVILILASLMFSFSFFRENKEKSEKTFKFTIFGGLFLTFPFVNGDFMAFSVYNLWISIGYLLTALAVFFSREFQNSGKKLEIIFAILLLSSAISIYQSFISVFAVIFIILEIQKLISGPKYLPLSRWIIAGITVSASTVIYLVLNTLAQRLITPAYGYLNTLIGWNREMSAFQVLNKVIDAIAGIYLGTYGSSGRILTISVGIFLVFIFCVSINEKSMRQRVGLVFLALLLIIAPFLTVIALGSMLPARSLNGLSLMLGGIWLLILQNVSGTVFKKISITTAAFLLFFQIQFLNSLFYGDYLRYQEDIFMGRQIIHQIETQGIDYRRYPIVFVGQHQFDSTKLISKINSGGRSFFDDSSQPYRMTYFLKTLGYQVILPTEAEKAKALEIELTTIWPEFGSIVFNEDIIIIKLSE
jgi:hypothetical protein